MIKKRLLSLVPESKFFIAGNVLMQWIGMCSNVVLIYTIANLLDCLMNQKAVNYTAVVIIISAVIIIRICCTKLSRRASYYASKNVKTTLRSLLYKKLLELGASYTEHISTAEIVQLAGDGVEQLETYFGLYMPQFFYAFLAPITLFFVIRPISFKVAIILFVCVPLIPVAIVLVQKIAKRLLKDYWGEYALLGDSFLENLQGLTTLKIYQADADKHIEMNKEAERFRIITMKVLTMQLNSIIVMDVVAYGGAALGILLAILEYSKGNIDIQGLLIIILLSADFFLPMRQLGSFFHVAMNGMTASDKIFAVLDIPVEEKKGEVPNSSDIEIKNLHFGYTAEKEIIHGVNMSIPHGSFTAIVGESGCGKSTIASLLTLGAKGYEGNVLLGNAEISQINDDELHKRISLISHNSYIFKGSLKENLLMGKPLAADAELWDVLKKVNLSEFVQSAGGLNLNIAEGGSNLSGGQRQRLALARAILHDSPIYIFDEATSNVDVESENDIMKLIIAMTEDEASNKTVIMISHRLANIIKADNIFVLENGVVAEQAKHEELLNKQGTYCRLWKEQQDLEQMLNKEDENHE